MFARELQIFGPDENQPLDLEGTIKAFEVMAKEVNAEASLLRQPYKSLDEVAYGFVKVSHLWVLFIK